MGMCLRSGNLLKSEAAFSRHVTRLFTEDGMQMASFVLNLREVLECGLAHLALAEAATSYHDQSKIVYTCDFFK